MRVYVSWNGATEVRSWRLHARNPHTNKNTPLTSVQRQGFETEITYDGYARRILVEALDAEGWPLGISDVTETLIIGDVDLPNDPEPWLSRPSHLTLFMAAAAVSVLLFLGWKFLRLRRNSTSGWLSRGSYDRLAVDDERDADDTDSLGRSNGVELKHLRLAGPVD